MKLEIKEFERAYKTLKSYLTPTPLVRNEWLSNKYGCNIFLKLENLQPVGSFKLRGATNMIANLSQEEKDKGVLAVSAGNHAQGVAWAAAKFGLEATIIMPKPSPIVKIMNTESLGAKVILEGENVDESFQFAKEYLKSNNKTYVHPFNDEHVIYGQGSIGYELSEQIENIDFIFGSIGGGGLMSGLGNVIKNKFPNCKVIGSQATGAASMIKSLQQGKLIECETVATFADGIKVKKPDLEMYKLLNAIIDEAVHITDDKVALSVLELMERARIIAEGAGAINLAAFDELFDKNSRRFKAKDIVLVICGGNIDINLVDRIIESGLIESKRTVKVNVLLEDRPGALLELTETLKRSGANVLHVVHKRDVPSIRLDQSMVEVSLESRGETHSDEIFSVIQEKFKLLPRS